jgi:hypothetical protein
MGSPNGFDFNIKDLSVLACSKRVRLAIVSDTYERVVMFLTFRYAIAVEMTFMGQAAAEPAILFQSLSLSSTISLTLSMI